MDHGISDQVDLFGNPWFEDQRKRGRPPHVRTVENANKIKVLFALGYDPKDAAMALNISMPTLRKRYKEELKDYFSAQTQLKAAILSLLWEQCQQGNVAALKEMSRHLDAKLMGDLAETVANREPKEKKPKPGKKEMQIEAAGEVVGKFGVPEAPLLN